MVSADTDYVRALAAAHDGRLSAAARLCETVLARAPAHAGALRLLAFAASRSGDSPRALELLAQAGRAAPGDGRLVRELGDLLTSLGRTDEAVAAYAEAVRRAPADIRAGLGLASSLRRLGRPGEAIAALERTATAPTDPRSRRLLAALLRDAASAAAGAGDHAEAARLLGRVVGLADARAGDFSNLGSALLELGRWSAAEAALRRAAALAPASADIRANLANLLMLAGRYPEAVGEYEAAAALDPAGTGPSYNRGHALVAVGRLSEAWAELDRHWTGQTRRRFAVPAWDGSRTPGGVLLWSQHGIGDEVLSLGMAEEAARRAGRLVVECDRRLLPVLRRAMPGLELVARGSEPPAVSAHFPACRLPRLFRSSLADFPDRPAYLRADSTRLALLSARYRSQGQRLVVGIAWRSTNAAFGLRKSIPLADWRPLFARRPARWISLQHGDSADELAAAGGRVQVDPEIDPLQDIDGLLAQIAAVDLVITASNSTAHLAGALGKPCWVLLPCGSGLLWHWLLPTGARSPWYPSVRLFRSDGPDDWDATIARAADALDGFGR
ncbi:tetratricopeptide repeat protein [Stella sp.]|uniref:tetratricopeptide repeat protein n=1 Tax=Stella sp. TaxID=2912054 RepID=UPI0035B07EDC